MSHAVRINPSDTYYVNGQPVPASYFQKLDTAQSGLINADAGGTWAPTAPILLGGEGLWFASPTSLVGNGATIVTPPGSGKRLVFGANDTPLLAPGHVLGKRRITTSILASGRVLGVTRGFGNAGQVNIGKANFVFNKATGTTDRVGKRILVPLRVHHGATLAAVELDMNMVAHTAAPSAPGMWRVYAVDVFGTVFPLNTDPTVVRSGGWLPFPPTAWAITGRHVLLYATPIAAVIDARGFGYMVEIVDEGGANSHDGNEYLTAVAIITNITNMGAQ